MIDYEGLIAKYCAGNVELQHILLTHSRRVADRALAILKAHPEWIESGEIDPIFVEEAAMLHDIGVVLCDAPKIHCMGTHAYIEHGYLGAEILRQEGLPKHAAVAERHTGTGITYEQIVREHLPMPLREYSPQTLEEKIVAHADNLISGTEEVDIDFVISKWKRTIEDSDDNIERLIELDNELIKSFEE